MPKRNDAVLSPGLLEIPAADVGRAVDFYQRVFGCVMEGLVDGARCFRVRTPEGDREATAVIRARVTSDETVLNHFATVSFGDVVGRVLRHGGSVMILTKVGHSDTPFAYCRDTEGNRFSLERAGSQTR
ncbi:MAG TPA: hypothetical protein VHE78_10035 [Gemmatimonadaceae bacterium]|nr:hypothetical protein [Gemmatimonadaceae bacterium]